MKHNEIHRIWFPLLFLLTAGFLCSCSYSFTYVNGKHISDCSDKEILDATHKDFLRQEYEEAAHLGAYISEHRPNAPELEEALYLAGESSFRVEEYWDSYQHFKKLLTRFPASQYVSEVPIRYFDIGEAYLDQEPGFFGTSSLIG